MSKLMVHQADSGKAAIANPFLPIVEQHMEAVRRKAFELFQKRGCAPGGEFKDWLEAEKELFFLPQAEVKETESSFTIKIATTGFESARFEIFALPSEILLEARAKKSDNGGVEQKCLYRRFELSTPIDARNIHASMDHGQLTIEAPKKLIHNIAVQAAAA